MKLTNVEVLEVQAALAKLQEIKMPVKVSIDLALLMNEIEQSIKAFGTVRDKLFKTYSIQTEKGEIEGQVKFFSTEEGKEEENLKAFLDEWVELLEAKATEATFPKVKLPADLEVEPAILKPLTRFVEVA